MGDLLDDILKEDTLVEDDIKEKSYIEESKGTRSYTNDPLTALCGNLRFFRDYPNTTDYTGGWLNFKDIPIGSKYKVVANILLWDETREIPLDGYYIRGEEYLHGVGIDGYDAYETNDYKSTSNNKIIISYELYEEPTPEPTPEPEYPTVSENIDYRPAMNRIIENQERIISQNELLTNELVSIGDDLGNYINNQTVSVDSLSSNNIMYKMISDYSVSESLMLLIALGMIVAGIVVLIKRSIPRWH